MLDGRTDGKRTGQDDAGDDADADDDADATMQEQRWDRKALWLRTSGGDAFADEKQR